MKKGTIITLSVIGVIVLLVIGLFSWGVSTNNNLIDMEETVNASASDLQSQLQRRADLIPNLVNTVKGYAEHETEVYTALADARAKLAGAGNDVEELQEANDELSSALSRLLVIVENYPELKANENFINLQDELAGTENRINIARMQYNETVQEFNTAIRKFPKNIIAGMLGFEKAEYFEMDESAADAPDVEF